MAKTQRPKVQFRRLFLLVLVIEFRV